MKIKTDKYTRRLRCITSIWRALTKLKNTKKKEKKLNSTSMMEHKTDIDITKIEKYQKLNMKKHKTDMIITKIDKYNKKLSRTFTTEHNTE